MSKIIKKEYSDRTIYTLNGVIHREDGPAIEYHNGDKLWYINGHLHREDGPAAEQYGDKAWCLHGKIHRENGPAIERADGSKQYWVNDKPLGFITNDQMLIYYLKYGFLQ